MEKRKCFFSYGYDDWERSKFIHKKTNKKHFVFKEDFNIQDLPIQNAKSKIRAFDYLGPAFIKYNNINLKILNYSEIEQGSSIELSDGLLYPLNVIPEGKSKMLFEDYLRGLK